jgi:hypothetical protein
LLADVGYAIRRYDTAGSPVLQSDISETPSSVVWHKDIVLEDLGEITQIQRISDKADPASMSAQDVAFKSLLFVANAYTSDGSKAEEAPSTVCEEDCANGCSNPCYSNWITDMFVFDLIPPDDDYLFGDSGMDVLIGQRGDGKLDLAFPRFSTTENDSPQLPTPYCVYLCLQISWPADMGPICL